MQSYYKIAISGDLGSGKSTVSEMISKELSFKRYSTGDIQRSLAAKYNMTTLEFNKYTESRKAIDHEIDNATAELAKTNENIVFDSRLAWHFVPNSFKIRLIIDKTVAAGRIFNACRGEVETYKDIEEAINKIAQRKNSEKTRFLDVYGINLLNFDNYDLIVDTSYVSPEEVTSQIIKMFKLWCDGKSFNKLWVCPKNVYPTKSAEKLNLDNIKNIGQSICSSSFKEDSPIIIARVDEFNFIIDGHDRVSAAILNDIKLIPAFLAAEDDGQLDAQVTGSQYVHNSCTLPLLHDWEGCHKYRYASYPGCFK